MNSAAKGKGPQRASGSFERSQHRRGGASRSYSEGVSAPKSAQQEKKRLIIIAVITVILPPAGILCLWRGGFLRVPYRLAATFLAFWLMVLYFSWMIPAKEPNVIHPQLRRASAVTEYSSSSAYNPDGDGSAQNQ